MAVVKMKLFKFNPEDSHSLTISGAQAMKCLRNAQVDRIRLEVIQKWITRTSQVGQWYNTPYGKLVRIQ